jgi:hypothetical protein
VFKLFDDDHTGKISFSNLKRSLFLCVCVCVCACVRACVCARVCTYVIHDVNLVLLYICTYMDIYIKICYMSVHTQIFML